MTWKSPRIGFNALWSMTYDLSRGPSGGSGFRQGERVECQESKAFIAPRGNFIAFPPVRADSADIRQKDARLAGDIGPHVPGVGLRIQRAVRDLFGMRNPRVLRFHGWFD